MSDGIGIAGNRMVMTTAGMKFYPSGSSIISSTYRPNLVRGVARISCSVDPSNNINKPPLAVENLIIQKPVGIGRYMVGNPNFEIMTDGIGDMIVGHETGSFEVGLREFGSVDYQYDYTLRPKSSNGVGDMTIWDGTVSARDTFEVGKTEVFDDNTGLWLFGLSKHIVCGYYVTSSIGILSSSTGISRTYDFTGTVEPTVSTASISSSFNCFVYPSASAPIHYIPIPIVAGDSGQHIATASVYAINHSPFGPSGKNFISASYDHEKNDSTFWLYDRLGGTSQLDTRKNGIGWLEIGNKYNAFQVFDLSNGIGDSQIGSTFRIGDGYQDFHATGINKGPVFTAGGGNLTALSQSTTTGSGIQGRPYYQGVPQQTNAVAEFRLDSQGSKDFLITGSSNASIYFSGSGKIGVGTTNPTHSFEVSGTIKSTKEFKLADESGDAFRLRLVKDGEGTGKDSIEISSSADFIDFDKSVKFTAPVTMSTVLKMKNNIEMGVGTTLDINPATGPITASLAGLAIAGTHVLWVEETGGTDGPGSSATVDPYIMYIGNNEIDVELRGNPLHLKGDRGSAFTDARGDVSMSSQHGDIYLSSNDIQIHGPITTHITASGNIEAGSYISASEFRTTGHITASGNISSSGKIIGSRLETSDGEVYLDGVRNLYRTATNFFVGATDRKTEIDGTNIKLDAPVTASGDISSSGIITDEITAGSTPVGLTITGNVTASGYISASGTQEGGIIARHITIHQGGKIGDISNVNGTPGQDDYIEFDYTNRKIYTSIDNSKNFTVHDGGINVEGNISASGNVTASGNISSSVGSTLSIGNIQGAEVAGDPSGSLTLSGSLTFRNNEAYPAVSESALFSSGSTLYWGGPVANISKFPIYPKKIEHFYHNFSDDFGTTKHYIPWHNQSELSSFYGGTSGQLFITNAKLIKVFWRAFNWHNSNTANMVMTLEKCANGTSTITEVGQVTLEIAPGNAKDAMMFDFVNDLDSGTNTVSAGELVGIGVAPAADLTLASSYHNIVSVWELDYSTELLESVIA